MRMTLTALPITSAERYWPLGPRGIYLLAFFEALYCTSVGSCSYGG